MNQKSEDRHETRRRGLAYVGASLSVSAAILQAIILIAVPGGLLDSQEIERDPQGQARRVSKADLPLSSLLYILGDGFDGQAANSINWSVRSADLAESPESVRWEEYMAPIMEDESGDAYDPHDAYPEGMPEVFHWQVGSEGEGCDTVSEEVKT